MVTESLSPHFLSLSLALEAINTDDIVGLLLLSQSLDQPDDLGPLILDLVRAEPVVQILHVLRELSDARIDLAGCKMTSDQSWLDHHYQKPVAGCRCLSGKRGYFWRKYRPLWSISPLSSPTSCY